MTPTEALAAARVRQQPGTSSQAATAHASGLLANLPSGWRLTYHMMWPDQPRSAHRLRLADAIDRAHILSPTRVGAAPYDSHADDILTALDGPDRIDQTPLPTDHVDQGPWNP
jgi:hypothetical protein